MSMVNRLDVICTQTAVIVRGMFTAPPVRFTPNPRIMAGPFDVPQERRHYTALPVLQRTLHPNQRANTLLNVSNDPRPAEVPDNCGARRW